MIISSETLTAYNPTIGDAAYYKIDYGAKNIEYLTNYDQFVLFRRGKFIINIPPNTKNESHFNVYEVTKIGTKENAIVTPWTPSHKTKEDLAKIYNELCEETNE